MFISLLSSYILNFTGTTPGIICMVMISMSQCLFMLSWTPNPASVHVIFLMVIGFALSTTIGQGQILGKLLIF